VNGRLTDILIAIGLTFAWIFAVIGGLLCALGAFLALLPIDGDNWGFSILLVGGMCVFICVAVIRWHWKRETDPADNHRPLKYKLPNAIAGTGITLTILCASAWLWLGGLDRLLTPTEQFYLVRQKQIPQTHVELHVIAKAPNGDFIVAGTRKTDTYHAWASRVNPQGETRWEFMDEVPESPENRTANGSVLDEGLINSVVTLSDSSTLLCGTRPVAKHIISFVVHLDSAGKVLDQHDVIPEQEGLLLFGVQCVQWGDGAALFGTLVRNPVALGWVVKLDNHANPVWEHADEHFVARDGLETADHHIVLFSDNLVVLDDAGNMVAQHDILGPVNPWVVHPMTESTTIKLAIASSGNTQFIEFDQKLHIVSKTNRRSMIIQKAYEMPDRSLIIFGFPDGGPANVTRVYSRWGATNYLLDRTHRGSYQAAVLGDTPNEFVAVRQVNWDNAVIEWIKIRADNAKSSNLSHN
jgi:hypothetical protein